MAIKWGFSTLGCPELNLKQVVDLAKEFEFDAVDLWYLNDSPDLYRELSSFLGAVGSAEKIFAAGVDVSCLETSYRLSSSPREELDEFKRIARLADRLQTRYLRVVDGVEYGQNWTDPQKEAARKNFEEWKLWRRENGIRAEMVLETQGSTSSASKLYNVFDIVGAELPVIWDIHHTMAIGREDPDITWSKLGDRIVHIHIKDSIDRANGAHPYTCVLPGAGRIPAREIIPRLKTVGYSGVVSLVWEKKWHSRLPPLRDALRAVYSSRWRK